MLEYTYNAAGTKQRQIEYKEGVVVKTTDFVANFVFINGKPAWYNFDEGRIVYSNNNSYFTETFLKDHLGNIRVVFGYSDNNVITRQVNSYYPFGMNIKGLTANSVTTKTAYPNEYLYNGKLIQDEMNLGWLDYGRRMYDLQLGRWHSVDPLAEKYRKWSPYNYCVDNPMRFVDPDGMASGDPPYLWATQGAPNLTKNLSFVYNNLSDNTKRVVNASWNIISGTAQFIGGASFATITLPTGVGEIIGGAVAMHGAYKTTEGIHQLSNVTSGTDKSEDPKYSTPEGAITKSETVDHAVDLVASGPGINTPVSIANVVNNASTLVTSYSLLKDVSMNISKNDGDKINSNTSETQETQCNKQEHPLAPQTTEKHQESWLDYR